MPPVNKCTNDIVFSQISDEDSLRSKKILPYKWPRSPDICFFYISSFNECLDIMINEVIPIVS